MNNKDQLEVAAYLVKEAFAANAMRAGRGILSMAKNMRTNPVLKAIPKGAPTAARASGPRTMAELMSMFKAVKGNPLAPNNNMSMQQLLRTSPPLVATKINPPLKAIKQPGLPYMAGIPGRNRMAGIPGVAHPQRI